MTNENIYNLSRKSDFRIKIEAGIVIYAINDVSGEDPAIPDPDLTTIQAQKRHALSTSVLNGAQEYAIRFSIACAARDGLNAQYDINLAYTGGDEDAAINNQIENIWDNMAGVSFLDLNP